MSKRIVDTELLKSDIRSLTSRVRGLKQRINNALKDADIYSRIERVFINQGYDYTIYKDEKTFSINVKAHNFCVTGKISKTSSIKLGMIVRYDDVEESSSSAQCGFIDFPIYDLEVYLPLIDKMIADGAELAEKYDNLRKKEKSAELLEIFVREYMGSQDVKNIDVSSDDEGELWVIWKFDDNAVVRIPVNFDNYKSQCDTLIKYRREQHVELEGTNIEVLNRRPDYYRDHNRGVSWPTGKIVKLNI